MRTLRRWSLLLLLVFLALLVAGCAKLWPGSRGTGAPGTDVGHRNGAVTSSVDAMPSVDATSAVDTTPTPLRTPDAEALAQQLQEGDSTERLSAVWSLPERGDLSVETRAGLLVEGLEEELAAPAQDAPLKDSYLPASALLRLHFTRVLSELGPEAIPALRAQLDGASGAAREQLLVALAYAGDEDVLPQVRELVTQAADPVVRMDAARALGQAGDEDALPQLQAALADPYVVTAQDDLGTYTIYPVREQAAGALRALGVTVERRGDGEFAIGG
jgi:HEAT repeat protein